MTEQLPRVLAGLLKARAPGWRHTVTHARGPIEVTHYGAHRSDGTRPTLTRHEDVDSVCLRACHPDTGRAVVALWTSRGTTAKGAPSWSLDMAWRGRHDGEHAPQPLDGAQLGAYLAAPNVAAFTAAEAGIAARKTNAAKKAAATRAAKKQAAGTDLSTSAPTEIHSPLLMEVA